MTKFSKLAKLPRIATRLLKHVQNIEREAMMLGKLLSETNRHKTKIIKISSRIRIGRLAKMINVINYVD